jgi:hypothetical protein
MSFDWWLSGLWCKRLSDEGHVMMRRFVSVEALFNGWHFDRQIIIVCVSWYTSFKLSFRDLVIIMAERGISTNAVTRRVFEDGFSAGGGVS